MGWGRRGERRGLKKEGWGRWARFKSGSGSVENISDPDPAKWYGSSSSLSKSTNTVKYTLTLFTGEPATAQKINSWNARPQFLESFQPIMLISLVLFCFLSLSPNASRKYTSFHFCQVSSPTNQDAPWDRVWPTGGEEHWRAGSFCRAAQSAQDPVCRKKKSLVEKVFSS